MPKVIYSLEYIFALISELTLLLNENSNARKILFWDLPCPGSANLNWLTELSRVPWVIEANDTPTASATDCSASGAWGEWPEPVLSVNASTTACFTADEMDADNAVILTAVSYTHLTLPTKLEV